MDWTRLTGDDDLARFLELVSDFHDSCLREIHIWGGAYVAAEDLGMFQPLGWDVSATVVVQRQDRSLPVVELWFGQVVGLGVSPVPPGYSHEITLATLVIRDGTFYWGTAGGWDPSHDPRPADFTWVAAYELRWRARPDWLGSALRYGSRND